MPGLNGNDGYVIALLNGTKEGKLNWQRDNQSNTAYPAYCLFNNDQKLSLVKYDATEYDLAGEEYVNTHSYIIITGPNNVQIGEILEDDLSEKGNLWRLYRLVERQVNRFDESIGGFIEGLTRYEF